MNFWKKKKIVSYVWPTQLDQTELTQFVKRGWGVKLGPPIFFFIFFLFLFLSHFITSSTIYSFFLFLNFQFPNSKSSLETSIFWVSSVINFIFLENFVKKAHLWCSWKTHFCGFLFFTQYIHEIILFKER